MHKRFLIVIFVLIAAESCCYKKKCGSGGVQLNLIGFTSQDADTIYQIENGDTSLHKPELAEDSVYKYWLSGYGDMYKSPITVWVPGADKIYLFSNFTYEKENCNQCFPFGHDKYDAYKECVMNGVRYTGTVIEVYK